LPKKASLVYSSFHGLNQKLGEKPIPTTFSLKVD